MVYRGPVDYLGLDRIGDGPDFGDWFQVVMKTQILEFEYLSLSRPLSGRLHLQQSAIVRLVRDSDRALERNIHIQDEIERGGDECR